MWLAARYPHKVKSLSLHSAWTKTDPFLRTVLEGWRVMAKGLESVTEMVILGILPWCLTPELYAAQPDYIQSLAAFIRGRPAQPLDAFMRQSNAVIAHDVESQLGKITAPTQITFGQRDLLTSTRFADPIQATIQGAELKVFENCSHGTIYEKVDEFNQKTLEFLQRHSG
jgi:pimeloyl-ACP methyl ester carboxylesterase